MVGKGFRIYVKCRPCNSLTIYVHSITIYDCRSRPPLIQLRDQHQRISIVYKKSPSSSRILAPPIVNLCRQHAHRYTYTLQKATPENNDNDTPLHCRVMWMMLVSLNAEMSLIVREAFWATTTSTYIVLTNGSVMNSFKSLRRHTT